ncbi:major facilitator superfamily domain-containing protein 6-like [Liolophura sinensis]|uniref:major facilitator superfamily domain-containing protein 6-like n=1 Tax=Liolophura sinensis TaxID=3198878 RepID=UPI003159007A
MVVQSSDRPDSYKQGTCALEKSPSESLPNLAPYKASFFFVISSHGVISSFLPLYFKQIGLSPGQIGTVMFFRPMGGFFGGLLVPHISKTFSSERKVAMAFSCLLILSTFAIYFPDSPALASDCPLTRKNTSAEEISVNSTLQGDEKLVDRVWMYEMNARWLPIFLYGLLLFCAEFFHIGMDAIQHGVTMKVLRKENSKLYGTVRAWGALGYAAAAISTGLLIYLTVSKEQVCSKMLYSADYHFLFYSFTCFAFMNLLNVNNLFQGTFKEDDDSLCNKMMSHSDFRSAMCSFHIISWLLVLLGRSVFYAVTQGFLNWHLENIGASPALIGIANCTTTTTEFLMFFATPKLIEMFGQTKLVAVGILSYACRFLIFSLISNPFYILPVEVLEGASPGLIGMANGTTTITEFFMFFATPRLIDTFGHTKLVAVGVLSYAGRFIVFSIISNPLYIFPVEILEGVMFACIWSSMVSYLSNQVPEEGQTQVQGLIQSLCMLGTSIGFPLSGLLTQLFGTPSMFQVFAVLALMTFVIFVLAQLRPMNMFAEA